MENRANRSTLPTFNPNWHPSLQKIYASFLPLSLEERRERIKREYEQRVLADRIGLYQPNLPVESVIQSIATSGNLVHVLSAANGIGKTTALVNVAGNLIFGPQNRYFRYPLFLNWPYPKRIRIVSEVSQVKESGPIPTEIGKWWPKGKYESLKAGHPYPSEFKAGEWILEVMTYDQAKEQHEGANLGAVLFNEPPPRHLWTPNISRLRAGGFAAVFMTPLTEAGWFFDEVVPRHEPFVFYADVETACKQHGVRGHLEHDDIQKLIAEYDEEEREARVGGKAMYLRGLIFKTFNSKVHVLKENVRPPHGAQVWNIVDPHSDKPFASIWAFPDARGDIYIFDEWPNEDFYKMHNCQLTVIDYKRIFGDKEAGLNIHRRIIDRHFADVASAANKRTLRQELQAVGLFYHPSYKAEEEVDTGIEKVRRHLAYDTSKDLGPLNQPSIYINPSCTNTIKSLTHWARDPENGKVKDAFKDFCDCVRYLVMDNPKISEPLPPQEFKKRW